MFQHQLLLLYRQFNRHKSSFFINLTGLSAGISCALFIFLWVNDEMQMDGFHDKNKQLYQVMKNLNSAAGITTTDATPGILAAGLLNDMSEVEDAVTVSPDLWLENSKISIKGNSHIKAGGKFAGESFFNIFSYELISGNRDHVLKSKNSIVISERLAKKLFHTTEVLGKEITWSNAEMQNENHALVSGVFKDTPSNSSTHFDFLVSLDFLYDTAPNYKQWGNYGPNTFIVLKKGTNPKEFNLKLHPYLKSKGVHNSDIFMRPFADGYLYGNYENGKQVGGRIEYIKLFSLIAVFILIIACINFMNLSTARASKKTKEIGIKKVLGARRESLILQYLAEAIILAFIALFISLLCVELLLPQFNQIVDKELALRFDWKLILSLTGLTLFTGLMAGSYPALYLSGFNPAAALKGKLSNSISERWTRRGLVIFQFTLSIILIVSVLVIYKQIQFVQTRNPGFIKDNVLYFETEGKIKNNVDPFLKEIKKLPGVINASSINRNFLGDLNATEGDFHWEGRNPKEVIRFQSASVNNELIETMGMEMIAGRSFSDKFGADSSKIIINEAGIKVMRLKDPVGKIFNLWGKDLEIIGVVKDFHFESLHKNVNPMFLRFASKNTNRIMVRLQTGKEKEAIAGLSKLHTAFNPGFPLDFKFLDQDYQAQYVAENRVAILSRYFAGLAIIISCLGLFGLATFTAERKFKEIGIRKVLGASNMNIVYLLSKEFIKPVLLSIFIALPLSYVVSRYWLDTFAYRIELQLWYFIGAGLLALLISWLTVGMQAIKAAASDPVQCLREE